MGFRTNVVSSGPGRFEGCGCDARLAEAVYASTLSGGCAEEAGDACAQGWAGLVLSRRRAYIATQDGYGFVTVTVYDDHATARAEWAEVARDLGEAADLWEDGLYA